MRFASLRPVIHSSWNSRIDLLHEWFILICTTKWYGSLKTQKNTVTVTAQHSATRITFVHMTVIIIAVYCISGWDIVQRIEPFINPEMCGYFSISSIVFEPNWFSSMQNVWIKAPYKRDTSVREKQRRQQQQQQQHFIRMKSHWIKWVRLFYTLFYIYIVILCMSTCIFFVLSLCRLLDFCRKKYIYTHKKKNKYKINGIRKQTEFNIDQEQVAPSTHRHTFIWSYFNFIFAAFFGFYLFIYFSTSFFFNCVAFVCEIKILVRFIYFFLSVQSLSLSHCFPFVPIVPK